MYRFDDSKLPMAGLEPARAFYGPTDFKSVASAISPHRRDRPHSTLVRAQTKIFHSTITYSAKIPAAELLQQTRCAIWFLPTFGADWRFKPPSALNLCDHSCSHLLGSWSRLGIATFAALPEIHQLHELAHSHALRRPKRHRFCSKSTHGCNAFPHQGSAGNCTGACA
jgi:hypothetical protein